VLGQFGLRAAAIAALIGLAGCYQTVNAPNPNAPPECANLDAEISRRVYAYNAKIVNRISGPGPKKLDACSDLAARQRAEMSAIVALGDQINAKKCYQRNVEYRNRRILDSMRAELAKKCS